MGLADRLDIGIIIFNVILAAAALVHKIIKMDKLEYLEVRNKTIIIE